MSLKSILRLKQDCEINLHHLRFIFLSLNISNVNPLSPLDSSTNFVINTLNLERCIEFQNRDDFIS